MKNNMGLSRWLHHLFNPHCESCRDENSEAKICKSCEVLRQQLDIANYEKRQLLEAILSGTPKDNSAGNAKIDYEPIKPKSIPWAVRQQMLEAEDRKTAELMARSKPKTKSDLDSELLELERSVGIMEGDENGYQTN